MPSTHVPIPAVAPRAASRASFGLILVLAFVLAAPALAATRDFSGLLGGGKHHAYSFFVTESGLYTLTSGPQNLFWQGSLALHAPTFDPATPLKDLVAADPYAPGPPPAARIDAFLVTGVVYRLVTSNLQPGVLDEAYANRITGPGEILTSACFPVGDEDAEGPDDDDTFGFAVQRERFCVLADWASPHGTFGFARSVPHRSDDSVLFWFFAPANWELLVKVLDACDLNGHFWVFFSATTNVEFTLQVIGRGSNFPDLAKTYFNPQGHAADAVTDTAAFPCSDVEDQLP